MQGSTVLTERVGDVGVITLNRPEKLNALNRALMEDLEAAVRASEEDGVRALLLTGAGRGFCARRRPDGPQGRGTHLRQRVAVQKQYAPRIPVAAAARVPQADGRGGQRSRGRRRTRIGSGLRHQDRL